MGKKFVRGILSLNRASQTRAREFRQRSVWISFDMKAFQLDELFETEAAKCDTSARVLPSGPSQVL